ncbi:MAG: hypothetical protein NXI29_05525 [bacterium]|nr:hypothetical protein [bacterium]
MTQNKLQDREIGDVHEQTVIDRDGETHNIKCRVIGNKKSKPSADYMRKGSTEPE